MMVCVQYVWEQFASWKLENQNKTRTILRSRERGSHLVDVILDTEIYPEVMDQVSAGRWTNRELICMLNGHIYRRLSAPA